MASIESIKRKKGTSHAIRFYYRGKQCKIVLDAAYTRSDVDAALAAVEGVLRSERLEEPLDRKTRAFFEAAPADLLRRFSVFGFVAAKQNLTVSDVWKLYERNGMTTIKEGTVVHRETVYARFRAFFPADVRFSDLTPATVLEFRDELERLYAPTTVDWRLANVWQVGRRSWLRDGKPVLVGSTWTDRQPLARFPDSGGMDGANPGSLSLSILAHSVLPLASCRLAATRTARAST